MYSGMEYGVEYNLVGIWQATRRFLGDTDRKTQSILKQPWGMQVSLEH